MHTNKQPISVSVVVPVYNSAATLHELYRAIMESIDTEMYQPEIIFVDDHGVPEVWQKLEELKQQHPTRVKIIRLAKNFGQNNATLCGIDYAMGDWVITIDDDLEFDPKYINDLLQKADETGADVVYGVFKKQPGVSFRSLGRKFLFFILDRFENGANVGSSFRLIKKHVIEKINYHNQDHLFINQIISWYTSDIDYVTIEKTQRAGVKSGYSIPKLIGIGLRLLFYYTSFPLRLIIYFSFLTALVSFSFAVYYFIQKVTVGTLEGYSSMIVSIFVGTSVIMFSLGVLSIFVNRIYNTRVKKPNYSIKKIR
jgi:glycosyltransferase involved in cell wall biosynthesis